MVGWCALRVSGPRGTKVTLRFAETLKPDGTLYLANLRGALVTDTYTLSGKGPEYWEPRFVYHGFRYVEVSGYPGKPPLNAINGRVVHDDLRKTGDFLCSNGLLNRIYTNIVWGIRGNYRSIPTDCPQRDERQGWLGDRSEECRGEAFIFDTAALYSKWLQDMADSQKPSGSVPDVCPGYWPIYSDDVSWPSSLVIIPAALQRQFGDSTAIRKSYTAARKWVDYMATFVTNGIISKDSYGDWCVPPEDPTLIHSGDPTRTTDTNLVATAYFYHDLRLMESYANMLGERQDAARFRELAGKIGTAFNDRFLNKEVGQYDNGTQSSCVLPLAFGLVPENQRERIFKQLVHKVANETHGHIGTGLIGGQYLNRVLTENGRADLAYTIANQKDYPSWGYMVEKGATTIWELWNGDTADPAMNSGNHVMLVGDLVIWFYENLAGIKPDAAIPGFKHVIMRPEMPGDLSFVRASYQSVHGRIRSYWRRQAAGFDWEIEIPANVTATLYLPANKGDKITESKKSIDRRRDLRLAGFSGDHRAIVEIGSGKYQFHVSPAR
jgi:alpha-L-rhamnosidase